MDAITQGLLGAAVAQGMTQRRIGKRALAAGALAGMAADLDVFIRSAWDPLLGVTFHRHFTHSLIFIPLGALLVALPLFFLFKRFGKNPIHWRDLYAACFWGYATHALLDACTSYGTMLLWPFTHQRISWDCVSIVDPVFSLALGIGIWLAQKNQKPRTAWIAFFFCLTYLAFGEFQNRKGESLQREILASRGHETTQEARVMPTLGNLVVWRSLYRADDRLWGDEIRVPILPWKEASFRTGTSVPVFRTQDLPPDFLKNSEWKKDWEKFLWFTEGFVAGFHSDLSVSENAGATYEGVADLRYSSETGEFKPLWGIVFPKDPQAPHVGWIYFRINRREALKRLSRFFD